MVDWDAVSKKYNKIIGIRILKGVAIGIGITIGFFIAIYLMIWFLWS